MPTIKSYLNWHDYVVPFPVRFARDKRSPLLLSQNEEF